MTTEEHIRRSEQKLLRLTAAQRQLTDLFGMTGEGERHLATRIEQHEEFRLHHERTMKEIDFKRAERAVKHAEMNDKLNALIDYIRCEGRHPSVD
jgi:hypothetical protein